MTFTNTITWNAERIPGLVLGTAQLGMDYGVANREGRPSADRARAIVAAAWDEGVRFFDTAQAYGNSELVLGQALRAQGIEDRARVITKLHPKLDATNAETIQQSVQESVDRLGVPRLWALLIHRPEWLHTRPGHLERVLAELRNMECVGHLGVSVYTPEQARHAVAHPLLEIIQLPFNAWDQRAQSTGILAAAHDAGKLCMVRSIYLQGLLTMAPEQVAKRVPRALPYAERWIDLCHAMHLSPQEVAAGFALTAGTPLVIGAETVEQVRANAAFLRKDALDRDRAQELTAAMGEIEESVIDPSQWSAR